MDLIARFRCKRECVLLCFCLLLGSTFTGCSSRDNERKSESQDDSVKQESLIDNGKAKITNDPEVGKTYTREAAKSLEKQGRNRKPKDIKQELKEDAKKTIDRAFAKFDSLTDAEERIEFIEKLSEAYHDSVVTIVSNALNDKDPDVRLAAMDLLVDYESADLDVLGVVSRALEDRNEQIREAALGALAFVNGREADKLLIQALSDSSEDVRMAAREVAGEKGKRTRLDVLRAGIGSSYEDVKEYVVSTLIDLSNHDAVDILILGLKERDPEFREEVKFALEFLISKEFSSHEEAKNWWAANRDNYDDELLEKDE